MNDSTNVSPVFIEDEPDWSKPVQVVIANKTTISTARNEGRQRSRWRNQPKYSISYVLSALTTEEFSVRRAAMMRELQAPVVCPIWTDDFTVSGVAGLRVSFGESLARAKFKRGGYIMIQSDSGNDFRVIAAIGADYVDVLDGGAIAFPSVAYPCILGIRSKNSPAFTFNMIDNTDETLTVEEL